MENKKGSGVFLGVVSVATLIVAIIGATFAFFSTQTGSANDAINTTAYEFATTVKSVVRIYPEDNGAIDKGIIPLNPTAKVGETEKTLLARALENDTKCVDEKGYMVCALYKVTLENSSTEAADMNLTVKTVTNTAGAGGEAFKDLTFQALSGDETAFTLNGQAATLLGTPDQSVTIKADESNDLTITAEAATNTSTPKETVHYFVIYLNEATAETNQSTQMGAKFTGQLEYTTTTGGNRLTGTFTA